MGIPVDRLADEVQKELGVYSEDVTAAVKKAVDTVSKEAAETLKTSSPRRTGAYAGNWAQQNSYESTRTKRNTVFNRKRYQLTHILENGYAKRGGGRVSPRVHIATVEQKAAQSLENKTKEAVQG